jgi:long-subunit acyl-CoA synthetase (AMP-forming)
LPLSNIVEIVSQGICLLKGGMLAFSSSKTLNSDFKAFKPTIAYFLPKV